jgi:hypothetical protein
MHKILSSVVALAGLAVAGAVQAEDAVVAGDTYEPIELSLSQMDEVTAAGSTRVCVGCANVAVVSQWASAVALGGFFGDTEAEAENESEIEQEIN